MAAAADPRDPAAAPNAWLYRALLARANSSESSPWTRLGTTSGEQCLESAVVVYERPEGP